HLSRRRRNQGGRRSRRDRRTRISRRGASPLRHRSARDRAASTRPRHTAARNPRAKAARPRSWPRHPGDFALNHLPQISRVSVVVAAMFAAWPLFAVEPCRIEVVDKENGWPVPLVELRTTHHARYVTDNAGVIALDDPELFDHEVWFNIVGHGYGVKADGFGLRGVRLRPEAGKTLRVDVTRTNIAKRLGRI